MGFASDWLERVVTAFLVVFFGVMAATGVDVLDLASYKAAAVAGLAAGIEALRGLLASRVGDAASASLLKK